MIIFPLLESLHSITYSTSTILHNQVPFSTQAFIFIISYFLTRMNDNSNNLVSDYESDTSFTAGIEESPDSHMFPLAQYRMGEGVISIYDDSDSKMISRNFSDEGASSCESFEALLSNDSEEGNLIKVLIPLVFLLRMKYKLLSKRADDSNQLYLRTNNHKPIDVEVMIHLEL